ncbi:hypothetical protein I6F35_02630 [Bradyrhizobium sp. BRP22]|uniref:hypothetical protein n=1 Tax=Bradyrhizobium sp. BRP22 TaxID=2793821 RepID=UPI001CD3D46B|nr:hypothetical protein [Bradyrhizobium sp. BRP22]MCA1452109.1 hypothetical protein [Bradyrhizobium sp. BRP22]
MSTQRETCVEFICEECCRTIINFGHHDGIEVCGVCRVIREMMPDMPDDLKARLRGEQ